MGLKKNLKKTLALILCCGIFTLHFVVLRRFGSLLRDRELSALLGAGMMADAAKSCF
jgi:hypothetical protein